MRPRSAERWVSAAAPLLLALAILVGALGAQAGASSGGRWKAAAAAVPNLGAHQRPCVPGKDKTCCPGADCNSHPGLLPASPLLVETAVGTERISPHEIRVGQRFTIKFTPISPTAAHWTFPDIAKKVSGCRSGIDRTCTYLAGPRDVTYPEFATYNGWSDYMWSGGDINGIGVGYDYYAIISNRIAVTGRLADKHGKAIPRGGIQTPPGTPTPDPGVTIEFLVKRHGTLKVVYVAAPSLHSSPAHPYDLGYYGLLVKRGTYTVEAGDPIEHIACKRRVVHITRPVHNLNLVCKR